MQRVSVKIDDLFQFGDEPRPAGPLDVVALTPLVLKQFTFLPRPLFITVEVE